MAKKKHPPAHHRALSERNASYASVSKNGQGELKDAFEAARQITDQSCEDEQLHAASLYTRTLIEASLDPFVTISAEGKITDVNTATQQVTGCSRDELIGSDFSDYFTEPELARKGYQQVFADGFVKDYPLAIQHKSGSITDVLYNATVYRDEAGKVQGVFAAARDITELKQAQGELERYSGHLEALVDERTSRLVRSEEDFRTLFEASAVGQIRYDTDGRPIRMNHAMAELLGIDDVSKLSHLTIFSSSRVSEKDKARLHTGHPTHYEQVYDFRKIAESTDFATTRSDVRYFDVHLLPIFSTSSEAVEGYLAQYVDITERKEAEKALQTSEEQYRTLVETANSIICMVNPEGTITFVNEYGANFFGYRRNELIGKNVLTITPVVDSASGKLAPLVSDILAHPNHQGVHLNENTTKDGRRVWVNWVNRMITDATGQHIGHLAIGYDVTEQKRAEEALHDAQRLAGIGETAAMIGHDLRNPLQGLQYIVDLQKLRFEKIPPEKRSAEDWQKEAELFGKITEQVFYMDKIVGDLQDYARPLDPERESIPVRNLIDDVLQSLPHRDNNVDVNVNLPDVTVEAEPHLMHRLFSNLFLNAFQAMPDGGTLTIAASSDDGSLAISVSDTGSGIPDEMKDKLFSPLMTGKAKGTGLGLAVVKRIVDAHGGLITFESEKGKGTTFTVTLPASGVG